MRPDQHQAAVAAVIRWKWMARGAIACTLRFAPFQAAIAKSLGERGAALVEFAIVAPVLLLTMVGTAQFGIALNQVVMLSNAVTTGVQLFSISPDWKRDVAVDRKPEILDGGEHLRRRYRGGFDECTADSRRSC